MRLFKDFVRDAFPTNLEQYEEPPPKTLLTVKWRHNCLLPLDVNNSQLDGAYVQ